MHVGALKKGASMDTTWHFSQVVYYETPQKSMHPYDYIGYTCSGHSYL